MDGRLRFAATGSRVEPTRKIGTERGQSSQRDDLRNWDVLSLVTFFATSKESDAHRRCNPTGRWQINISNAKLVCVFWGYFSLLHNKEK